MDKEIVFQKITGFLTEIGINYKLTSIEEQTFLPGLKVDAGTLLIDKIKCLYYGDILHEAGHIAVLTPEERKLKSNDLGVDAGETAVILWSYAAALHIDLEPSIVFHHDGYKNEAEWLLTQFSSKNYLGLPLLQWYGLTHNHKNALIHQEKPFPHMIKWLRE